MNHEMIVTLSKGQQITIPSSMREELGLSAGSRLDMEIEKDTIVLRPVGKELHEMFKEAKNIKPKYKMTAKEMDELNERMFR